ncbi:MAG TPA: Gfo/Idh/MocA family oxidoreductase [Kiritimatiellia bacterium]|nr:Gfo/Idh/MocA family oxidoreductase [Kiritimatiellia bacterium]HMO97509.1 Gfo/Idh/MocA family oxidoreductase [Kiritimatiellia bacterium]HMP97148.1 Gfo/Idh/MocA family oxidoreductase [Kiritimatiellia bacterium]
MKTVQCGVIGAGNMGSFYADRLHRGEIPRARLVAVCDEDETRRHRWEGVPGYARAEDLFGRAELDAVIIATPHYAHTTLGIAALERGLHVLVDKPISVHKADALRLLAAHRKPEQVFAAMFNQRTDEYFLKIRELITGGRLGEIRRVNWIITNWFRTEAYYASGGWRATWAGEGGGVLLNQCPHQLDMLCWLAGTPVSVEAHCHFGKYHDIEVEDEVTAYLEFANGATGVFIAGTGEAPGTNRLEITGEMGKVVLENDRLTFYKNAEPMSRFSKTSPESFAAPAVTEEAFEGLSHGEQHTGVLKNFVEAVLDGAPLIAPAAEGLASVELANAMLLSTFERKRIELPIDAGHYEKLLHARIASSTRRKRVIESSAPADMTRSFS